MIGQTIRHYRVTELVGSGGMGVVYRAQDLKLSRMVALKFLHMNPAPTPTAVDRFMREARTASSLYPKSAFAESALDRLGQLYSGLRRYDLAAQALEDLVRRFPSNHRDAAWKAAKLYEDKLKDKTRARDVYATVPTSSSHYSDAQKKLR